MLTMEFKVSEAESDGKEVSLDKVANVIREALKKRFPGDSNRQEVRVHRDRFNFCCPFCGDSAVTARKKRGNLYLASFQYKCYNDGCNNKGNLKRFAEHFGVEEVLSPEEWQSVKKRISTQMDEVLRQRVLRKELSLSALISTDFEKHLVPRKKLMEDLHLWEIRPHGSMGTWLSKRFQTIDKSFAWDFRGNRLFIFNLDKSGELVFGVQTRMFKETARSKYFTYNLTGIHSLLLGEKDETKLEEYRQYDHVSTLFGILHVNFGQTVTLFEGPLDAKLFPNSVGMCSVKNNWPLDVDDIRWFQDNDQAGRERALHELAEGRRVFLWKKFMEENQLTGKKIKDYNDIVIEEKLTGKHFDIESCFSTHKLDGILI